MHSLRTIRKHTEPAFIEPMQCKAVPALPADEKWTFEIKFDGYCSIAVKREFTLFSRHEKVLNRRFGDGMREYRETGGILCLPYSLAMKAEALDLADRTSEAHAAKKRVG
jgi:hypothetical protein